MVLIKNNYPVYVVFLFIVYSHLYIHVTIEDDLPFHVIIVHHLNPSEETTKYPTESTTGDHNTITSSDPIEITSNTPSNLPFLNPSEESEEITLIDPFNF